jgi:hypothetical protein
VGIGDRVGRHLHVVAFGKPRRSRDCPSYLFTVALHVGSMLRFVKNWVNCKILGLPFGSRGARALALCGETLRQ